MEVIIHRTKKDFFRFINYWSFERKRNIRLLIFIALSLWTTPSFESIIKGNFFIRFLVILTGYLILMIIAYCINLLLLKKGFKTKKSLLEETIVSVTDEGISTKSVSFHKLILWEEINKIENSTEFIVILHGFRRNILIPKRFFNSQIEADNFYESLQKIYLPKRAYLRSINGKHLYKWAFLGLIPNVGLISGAILAFKGIFVFKDKKLTVIGIASIAFTFIFWFTLLKISNNSQSNIDFSNKLAISKLNDLVKDIEYHKIGSNIYPDNLEQLHNNNSFSLLDPMSLSMSSKEKFVYKKLGDNYTLYSTGLDRIANTKDDLYPSDSIAKPGFIIVK
jgi:hypothetical protein